MYSHPCSGNRTGKGGLHEKGAKKKIRDMNDDQNERSPSMETSHTGRSGSVAVKVAKLIYTFTGNLYHTSNNNNNNTVVKPAMKAHVS